MTRLIKYSPLDRGIRHHTAPFLYEKTLRYFRQGINKISKGPDTRAIEIPLRSEGKVAIDSVYIENNRLWMDVLDANSCSKKEPILQSQIFQVADFIEANADEKKLLLQKKAQEKSSIPEMIDMFHRYKTKKGLEFFVIEDINPEWSEDDIVLSGSQLASFGVMFMDVKNRLPVKDKSDINDIVLLLNDSKILFDKVIKFFKQGIDRISRIPGMENIEVTLGSFGSEPKKLPLNSVYMKNDRLHMEWAVHGSTADMPVSLSQIFQIASFIKANEKKKVVSQRTSKITPTPKKRGRGI